MDALETFQDFYRRRRDYGVVAQSWKAAGGKIVGHPDINCPEELIMAAGCLPLLMTGDPASELAMVGDRVDAACSQPARYFYEEIVSGRYDFVDVICTTGGDRWLAHTDGFLAAEKYLDPKLKFGASYYLERLRGTFAQHRAFNLSRMHVFREYLQDLTGVRITNRILTDAIVTTNETRSLLHRVAELRRTDPPRISGRAALAIIMASMLMPKQRYNELLRQFIDVESVRLPQQDPTKARVFVSGSTVDNLQLYDIIESQAAVVVGEDSAFGDRYAEMLVDTRLEPMEALGDRYTYKPLDPWMLGMKERIKFRVDAATASKAEGVIFFHLRHDNDVAWDYPDQKKALAERNIPVLALEEQDYKLADADGLRSRIAAFVHDLRSRRS